jgi:hypothetical protein
MPDSDYIIYADESGDHSLTKIDAHYPIFVVAFAIIEKATYTTAIQKLLTIKFQHFGHDMVVLHAVQFHRDAIGRSRCTSNWARSVTAGFPEADISDHSL